MNQDSYKEKLQDKRWLLKRERILERDGHRCVICGSREDLVVHHKQYHFSRLLNRFYDPWDYQDKYLITLCESCHKRGHELYDIPTFNV